MRKMPLLFACLACSCASVPPTEIAKDFATLTIEYPRSFTLKAVSCEADGYVLLFDAPEATQVRAFLAGTVVAVDVDEELGNIVVVSDGLVETTYAHLRVPWVREGERVEAGALVALSGMTGAVPEPALGVILRFVDGVGRRLRLVASK